MIIDFAKLLKDVCEANEEAWQLLQKYFEENRLLREEQEQAHLYIKQKTKQFIHAIYIRALLFDRGYGVKQDVEMAFILMREAAAAGHTAAIYEVGRRFLWGIGIEKNEKNALQWLRAAAISPHYYPSAMYHLGLIYEQGLGVTKDIAEATQWYEKARAKGYRF